MRDSLFTSWDLEQSTLIKRLTQAEVTAAWQLNLFASGDAAANTQYALTYLESLGYSAADALLILELKNKGPLDNASSPAKTSSGKNKGQTTSSASS
jgi:hypothetical protein